MNEDQRGSDPYELPDAQSRSSVDNSKSLGSYVAFWRSSNNTKPNHNNNALGSDDDGGGGSGDETAIDVDGILRKQKGAGGDQEGDRAELSFIGLISVCYFLVCGGAYGTEDLASAIPPLFAILGMLVVPWFWSLPIALIVAELGSTMPSNEGFLGWIRHAWGQGAAFIDGWIMIITIIIDQSLYPVIFISYVESIQELEPIQEFLISVGYILLAMCLNLLGVSSVGNASTLLTCLTLVPFAIYFVAGFFSSRFDPAVWFETEMPPGKEMDIALYLSVLVWATCAYEYSGFLAGDVANPRKVFPIAMFTVVSMMITTYLLPMAMTIATAEDLAEVGEGSYPTLAENLGVGKWMAWLIIAGGLASTMGTYITYLHTSSTALRGLSSQGMAPSIFNALPQFKAPIVGIVFFSCTTVILVNFDFGVLIQIESFLYCFHAILLVSCLLRLRIKCPEMHRPFSLPLGWFGAVVIPVFPMIVGMAQMVSIFWEGWIYGLVSVGLLILGALTYLAVRMYARYSGNPETVGDATKGITSSSSSDDDHASSYHNT